MPDALLTLAGISLRSPEGGPVFQDLNFSLERGARHHLQGGGGVGVTAFLRLCCGLAHPESGQVSLEGAPLKPYGQHPFLERGALGWVPSDGGLAVNLTLQANVALPLRFALGLDREEAARTALLWLERAGLKPFAQQRPHVPGDGQCWLAALARAAAKGSELWLVDRPAGGLDPRSLQAATELLEQVGQNPAVTMVLAGGDWLSHLGRPLNLAKLERP